MAANCGGARWGPRPVAFPEDSARGRATYGAPQLSVEGFGALTTRLGCGPASDIEREQQLDTTRATPPNRYRSSS